MTRDELAQALLVGGIPMLALAIADMYCEAQGSEVGYEAFHFAKRLRRDLDERHEATRGERTVTVTRRTRPEIELQDDPEPPPSPAPESPDATVMETLRLEARGWCFYSDGKEIDPMQTKAFDAMTSAWSAERGQLRAKVERLESENNTLATYAQGQRDAVAELRAQVQQLEAEREQGVSRKREQDQREASLRDDIEQLQAELRKRDTVVGAVGTWYAGCGSLPRHLWPRDLRALADAYDALRAPAVEPESEAQRIASREHLLVPDAQRGLYRKYFVQRLNDPTGKHKDCTYFVLDEVHDKFAGPALRAYAAACEEEFPGLAHDLRARHTEPAAASAVAEPQPPSDESRLIVDESTNSESEVLRKRIVELERKVRTVIDVDRTGLAAGLNHLKAIAQGYWWIPEGSWGNYDYTQQTFATLRAEVGHLIQSVVDGADRYLKASGARANEAARFVSDPEPTPSNPATTEEPSPTREGDG